MMMVGLELATSFTPSLLHHCSVSASLWKPPLWPSMVAVPLCLAKGVVQGGASPGEPPVAVHDEGDVPGQGARPQHGYGEPLGGAGVLSKVKSQTLGPNMFHPSRYAHL